MFPLLDTHFVRKQSELYNYQTSFLFLLQAPDAV